MKWILGPNNFLRIRKFNLKIYLKIFNNILTCYILQGLIDADASSPWILKWKIMKSLRRSEALFKISFKFKNGYSWRTSLHPTITSYLLQPNLFYSPQFCLVLMAFGIGKFVRKTVKSLENHEAKPRCGIRLKVVIKLIHKLQFCLGIVVRQKFTFGEYTWELL